MNEINENQLGLSEILNTICLMDREYEKRVNSGKPDNQYIVTELIPKCENISRSIVNLSNEEKLLLHKKLNSIIKECIEELGYTSDILKLFDNRLKSQLHINDEKKDVKKETNFQVIRK